jgi:hypothetical protein
MKRLVLLITMCICTANLLAEGRVFCEIVEYPSAGKSTKVTIDFGQEQRLLSSSQLLADDDGKTLIFNSQIDALNYMESLGWTFTQVYTKVVSNGACSTHWLLYKEVKEGIDPYEGLQTKKVVL